MIVEYPRYLLGIHATKRQKGERRGWIAAVQFSFLIITVCCALCCPVLCTVCVRVIYLMFAPSTQHPAAASREEIRAWSDPLVRRCVLFCTTVGKNLPVPLGEEGSQCQPDCHMPDWNLLRSWVPRSPGYGKTPSFALFIRIDGVKFQNYVNLCELTLYNRHLRAKCNGVIIPFAIM